MSWQLAEAAPDRGSLFVDYIGLFVPLGVIAGAVVAGVFALLGDRKLHDRLESLVNARNAWPEDVDGRDSVDRAIQRYAAILDRRAERRRPAASPRRVLSVLLICLAGLVAGTYGANQLLTQLPGKAIAQAGAILMGIVLIPTALTCVLMLTELFYLARYWISRARLP
ncbi:hypothetical protein [Nocardia cyriacigeorgica]|uniref:hypothetical protein n=1 Tax=Nocardia cyriacigeorgica TaxID=135487 RepID=UPI0024579957|nr:hypothetical protein [Nocardia cyriacigeorgica]